MNASDASPLCAALDALIPGGRGWPAASEAVNPDAILAALSTDDSTWVTSLLRPGADWPTLWSGVETDPAFDRLLKALNDAYYSSPLAARRLRALAEASPRDPDSRFDPALLDPERTRP